MESQRLPLMLVFLSLVTLFMMGCSGGEGGESQGSEPSLADLTSTEVPAAEESASAVPTPAQELLSVATLTPTELPSPTAVEEGLATSEPESLPVVDSLCREEEEVILSCRIASNRKYLSICGSAELTAHQGYMQYRFGSSREMVELEYPARIQNSRDAFLLARYSRPLVTYLSLSFEISQYLFDVYDESNAESGREQRSVGVRVIEPDGQQSDFVCGEPVVGELFSLQGIIPTGPWPPALSVKEPSGEGIPESLAVENVGYAERAKWVEFLNISPACQEEFQWDDDFHQAQNYSGLTFYPVEAEKYVVEVQCATFAYAYSFHLYLYDRALGTGTALLLPEVDPETKRLMMQEGSYGSGIGFDEATKRFTNFQKGRGLADCGIFYKYQLQADQLSLLEARYRACDMEAEEFVEPAQWEHIYP